MSRTSLVAKCGKHSGERISWACIAPGCKERFGCVGCILSDIGHFTEHKTYLRIPDDLFPSADRSSEHQVYQATLERISGVKEQIVKVGNSGIASLQQTKHQVETEMEVLIQFIVEKLNGVKESSLLRLNKQLEEYQTQMSSIQESIPRLPEVAEITQQRNELDSKLCQKLSAKHVIADERLYSVLEELSNFPARSLSSLEQVSTSTREALEQMERAKQQAIQTIQQSILTECTNQVAAVLAEAEGRVALSTRGGSVEVQDESEELIVTSDQLLPQPHLQTSHLLKPKAWIVEESVSKVTRVDAATDDPCLSTPFLKFTQSVAQNFGADITLSQVTEVLKIEAVLIYMKDGYTQFKKAQEAQIALEASRRALQKENVLHPSVDPRFKKLRHQNPSKSRFETEGQEESKDIMPNRGSSQQFMGPSIERLDKRRFTASNIDNNDARPRTGQETGSKLESFTHDDSVKGRYHSKQKSYKHGRKFGYDNNRSLRHKDNQVWNGPMHAAPLHRHDVPQAPVSDHVHLNPQYPVEDKETEIQLEARKSQVSEMLRKLEQLTLSYSSLEECRRITQGPRFTDEEDSFQHENSKPTLKDLFNKPLSVPAKLSDKAPQVSKVESIPSQTTPTSLPGQQTQQLGPLSARLGLISTSFAAPKEIISNVYKKESLDSLAGFFKKRQEFEDVINQSHTLLKKRRPEAELDVPLTAQPTNSRHKQLLIKPAKIKGTPGHVRDENIPPQHTTQLASNRDRSLGNSRHVLENLMEVNVLGPVSQNVQKHTERTQQDPSFQHKKIVPFSLSRSFSGLTASEHSERGLAAGKSFYFTGSDDKDFIQATLPQETFISTVVLEAPRTAPETARELQSLTGAEVYILQKGNWNKLTDVKLQDKSYVQMSLSTPISAVRIVRGSKMHPQTSLGLGRLVLLN